jgi:hypothetical protein
MAVLKTTGNKCNQCNADAKYYSDKKWWCGFNFYAHGYCKQQKKESKNDGR